MTFIFLAQAPICSLNVSVVHHVSCCCSNVVLYSFCHFLSIVCGVSNSLVLSALSHIYLSIFSPKPVWVCLHSFQIEGATFATLSVWLAGVNCWCNIAGIVSPQIFRVVSHHSMSLSIKHSHAPYHAGELRYNLETVLKQYPQWCTSILLSIPIRGKSWYIYPHK